MKIDRLVLQTNYYVDQWMPAPYSAPYHYFGSLVFYEERDVASESHTRLPDGRYPVGSYFKSKISAHLLSPVRWAGINNTSKVYWYSTSDPAHGLFAMGAIRVPSQETIDTAVRKFYARMNEEAANLMDDWRTRQESVDMIAKRVDALTRLVRKVRPGRRNWWKLAEVFGLSNRRARKAYGRLRSQGHVSGQGIKDAAASISAAYLELQFGLKPLYLDICNSLKLCRDGLPLSKDISASCQELLEEDETVDHRYTGLVVIKRSGTTKCRLTGTLQLVSPMLASAASVGINDLVSTGYEALRLSFLLDWVWDVGSWINDHSTPDGYNVADFCMTFTSGYIEDQTHYDIAPQGLYLSSPGVVRVTVQRKQRTTNMPSYPPPKLELPKVSLTHFWESVALLAQAYQSFGRK